MELDKKKNSDPKALTFEVWRIRTGLGQFGPKALCNGLIKPLDENPSFNFQKQDLIFSKIMKWIQWKYEISKNLLILGSGAIKLHLGHLGPVGISRRKSRTLAPIFTSKTSFSSESWVTSIKVMKPRKIYWPWGLGPRNYIWANWAQKTYPTIRPEPWLQYSETTPHFLKNHKMNPIKFWNVKKLVNLGTWGLETRFGPLGPRRCIQP